MPLAQLSALLFLIALTVSRLGLLLHELAGHAGVARLFGCRFEGLRLFAFGGGYVEYACENLPLGALLAIDLGGIALELAAGALLLVVARRRRGLLGLFLASAGLLFLLHAAYYAVTGIHYGVGDGRRLHVLLGERRTLPLWIGSLGLVAATYVAARLVAGRLAAGLPGRDAPRRVAVLAIASLAAAALHGALLLTERRIAADSIYAASFTPEPRPRPVPLPHEPSAKQPATDGPTSLARDPGSAADETSRLAVPAAPAPFPLRAVLGAGMGLAALLGFWRALQPARPEHADGAPTSARALVRAGVACALALATVLAVDRLL